MSEDVLLSDIANIVGRCTVTIRVPAKREKVNYPPLGGCFTLQTLFDHVFELLLLHAQLALVAELVANVRQLHDASNVRECEEESSSASRSHLVALPRLKR